jgi:alanyl-tRNA synthetase
MKDYWDDPYVSTFETTIVDVLDRGEQLGLVLDTSYFYPEGGGQPADRGHIASYPVLDVQEAGDRVVHVVARDAQSDRQLYPGASVSCAIDWPYRLNNMRLHSACHLLFGAARQLFPHVNYAGFNIGELGNLYLETGQQITAEALRKMQILANEVIVQDRPITTYWLESRAAAGLEGLALNMELPPDRVRIIDVQGWDVAACSGTHLHRTIEIGPVKVLARETHKKNVTRIDYAVGAAAVAAIAEDDRIVAETAAFLGTSRDQISPMVHKLSSDLQAAEKSLRSFRQLLVDYKGQELAGGGEVIGGTRLVVDAAEYLDTRSLRALVARLVSGPGRVVAALIGGEQELTIVAGCSASVDINLVEPIVRIAAKHGGGGGGKPSFVNAGGIKAPAGSVRSEVEAELRKLLADRATAAGEA